MFTLHYLGRIRMLIKLTILYFSLFSILFSQQFYGVDHEINRAINNHIFPGATIIVGNDSTILYHNAYGNFTYSAASTTVDTSHMFDLASCTKVFATTSCIMTLVDSGLVDIEEYVSTYIPEFAQNGKGNVKVKNLLLHDSGLKAYYTPTAGQTPQQIINAIYMLPLLNPIGTYVYSCLNFVTLMKVVEAVTGMPMYQYYGQILTNPLFMTKTMFSPPDSLHIQCLPTSSSSGFQGIVHDPLARGLDGYSGNAGLFSSTGDLAKICQILLNGGVYHGIRYFNESTVSLFTTRYSPTGSTRALGWGTNASGVTSAGSLFSLQSFGHTGYTGTSVWCDPVKNIFVVFLTNRVYPDDLASISSTRKLVHNSVVRAIEGIPPQPTLNSIGLNDLNNLAISWKNNAEKGPVSKTEIQIDFGAGFQFLAEFGTDTSEITIASGGFPADSIIQVKLINKFNNEISASSDIYPFKGWKKDVLIVDGYDRIGSWGQEYHHFATVHANSLPDTLHYESCDNNQVVSGAVNLEDYKYVLWILADESTADTTFSPAEQTLVANYFKQGGRLFISGSEIGWDLGRSSSPQTDRQFYNNFLRSQFEGDDSGNYNISGVSGTPFDGLSFQYGTASALYIEDYPDYISPLNNGLTCLKYSNGLNAGITYEGSYQGSTLDGKLVYITFPFETIVGSSNRINLMKKVINFFQQPILGIDSNKNQSPEKFVLFQNYPNPFNVRTNIEFLLPKAEFVILKIYNSLGQDVSTLISKKLTAGKHRYTWDASNFASGVYFYRIELTSSKSTNSLQKQINKIVESGKLVLLK